jgi:diadenosine tetraphosphate (Ap4A) HIT family hydrolase
MEVSERDCILCRGPSADAELERVEVWRDGLWRLTVSLAAEVHGFAYLEPLRHVAFIHELDGEEARTFGAAIAKCARALKEAAQADVVYVYIFGDGVPHLHVHLAPHRAGDALSARMIRGEIVEEKLPSGVTRFFSREFPALPREALIETAERVRRQLEEKG